VSRTTPVGKGWLALVLLVLATSAAAAPIRITLDRPAGPRVEYWGWDLKGNIRLIPNPARANELFGEVPANLLRIPVFANAHSADGTVDTRAYAAMLASIRNARAANPQLKIFASIKLLGADTFPAWLAGSRRGQIFANTVAVPDAARYAALLASYVRFLQSAGIAIDYLGIDNETEGAVPPAVYVDTLRALQSALHDLPPEYRAFRFVGPDAYSLQDSVNFMRQIASAGAGKAVDVAGSHYYYGTREAPTRSGWQQLAKASGQQPLWFTEAHINAGEGAITELRRGLAMVFSASIGGASGFVWWDPAAAAGSLRLAIEREVIRTMVGAQPVETSPAFREQDTNAAAPLYQAYRNGDTVWLWIVNPGRADQERVVQLDSGAVVKVTGATFWRGSMQTGDVPDGGMQVVSTDGGKRFLITTIPADSIGMIRLSIGPSSEESR
jgi:hypothetical protein